jgi:hypothetical protein
MNENTIINGHHSVNGGENNTNGNGSQGPKPGEPSRSDALKKTKELEKKIKSTENKIEKAKAKGEDTTILEKELTSDQGLLRAVQEYIKSLPIGNAGPDENQRWYKQFYAYELGFLIQEENGEFHYYNEAGARTKLRGLDYSDARDQGSTSPVDRAINRIREKYRVDYYATTSSGRRAGISTYKGNRILVARGWEQIAYVKGEFPTISRLITGMLGEEAIYANCWLHLAVTPLYDNIVNTAQALVLVGGVNTGKTAFLNLVVTPLLGGRMAKPYAFMRGKTTFNEELFECEHLKIDDEAPALDHETQMTVSAQLKQLTADGTQRCHGKGKKALTLEPFWRITAAINDSPEYLSQLSITDETLNDKLVILKTLPGATVSLVEELGGKKAFEAKIREELPHYLRWLLEEFEVPAELKATRYGLKPYRNAEIVKAAEAATHQMTLLNYLEELWPGEILEDISSTRLATMLSIEATPRGLVPNHVNTLGKYLSTLARIASDRVKMRKDWRKGYVYTLDFTGSGLPAKKKGSSFR